MNIVGGGAMVGRSGSGKAFLEKSPFGIDRRVIIRNVNRAMPDAIPQATEADERRHLRHVTDRIHDESTRFDAIVRRKRGEALAIKHYINENKADMDHAEKIATRGSADQATMLTDHAERRRQILDRLCNSPYFGRIDFTENAASDRRPYYIGIHSFHDPETDRHLVHDRRAPVSSMFYHHETGAAAYDAPASSRARWRPRCANWWPTRAAKVSLLSSRSSTAPGGKVQRGDGPL